MKDFAAAVSLLDPKQAYGLAFSGGCDSSFLLAACMRAGLNVKAYMVMTEFQAPFELEDARHVIGETAAPFELIRVSILEHEEVCSNPPDRCYYCKRFMFNKILSAMKRDGRTVLLDGTNATDNPQRRPGFRALSELGVRSPLREAGFTKEDVRAASRVLGLSTAEKPNFSCFATKVPQGERITEASLMRAAQAEGLAFGGAATWGEGAQDEKSPCAAWKGSANHNRGSEEDASYARYECVCPGCLRRTR